VETAVVILAVVILAVVILGVVILAVVILAVVLISGFTDVRVTVFCPAIIKNLVEMIKSLIIIIKSLKSKNNHCEDLRNRFLYLNKSSLHIITLIIHNFLMKNLHLK
jgi:hypothetical protein